MREAKHEKPFRGELLTIKEASKYSRIGTTTLYGLAKSMVIPSFRPLKGKTLIDSADLDDMLRESKRGPL